MSLYTESEYFEWVLPQVNKRLFPCRGDKARFARKYGVSEALVSRVASGIQAAPEWILELAKFERVIHYSDNQPVPAA